MMQVLDVIQPFHHQRRKAFDIAASEQGRLRQVSTEPAIPVPLQMGNRQSNRKMVVFEQLGATGSLKIRFGEKYF